MIKKIQTHWLVSILSGAALLFVIGGFLWAYIALKRSGAGPYILHFNDAQGITQVGGIDLISGVGLFGTVVVIIDALIALELDSRNRFLGKIVAVMALVFSVLLFIGFAAILNVN